MTCPSFCRPGTFAISRSKRTSGEVFAGSSSCSTSLGARRAGERCATTNIMASRTGGRQFSYAFGTNLSTGTIESTIHRAIASRMACPAGLRSPVSIARICSAAVAFLGRKFARMARNCSGASCRKPSSMADGPMTDEPTIEEPPTDEPVTGESTIAKETSDEPGIESNRSYDSPMQACPL